MRINYNNAEKVFGSSEYKEFYVNSGPKGAYLSTEAEGRPLAVLPNISAEQLGSTDFKKAYGTKYAYYAGAMAGGISSTEMVIELGKAGFMGSYGSGGQSVETVRKSVEEIQRALPDGPYLINVLANISNPGEELKLVQMLIEKDVRAIEASAFIKPSEAIVYYRLRNARMDEAGRASAVHKIIAKISREEVAVHFLSPPDGDLVEGLVRKGLLTREEADCAPYLPLADDITVEADSGGHTDNRPLISMLPAMVSLRNSIQKNMKFRTRIGAGGGIATGRSALSAFVLGADYVVTGSVNQSCVEAGTSEYVKDLLARIKMADTVMCPSADMFELGGRVQVIKTGTMFPQKAQKLYNYYMSYPSYESIPEKERSAIELRILGDSFENIWRSTREYFEKKDPGQILRAEAQPKLKMALVFRWYLGNSSRWAQMDEVRRRGDMQIWCGQSLGAFNMEVRGTELEQPKNRRVAGVAGYIMQRAAVEQNKYLAVMAGVPSLEFE